MTRPSPLPRTLAGRAFTVHEARRAGLSRRRLRSTDLVRPTRGARLPRVVADDHAERCRAVLALSPPSAAVSHVSALRLLRVDLPARLAGDARVHVTVLESDVAPQRRGVVTHTHATDGRRYRGRRLSTVIVGDLPVVAPARTWLQLAATLSADELVALGDAMTRRRTPVTTVAALRAEVAAAPPGTRGIRAAREAVELVRPGTDSSPESRVRLLMVRAGLPCPLVNAKIYDVVGRFVAMPDLALPELRIAIEYDGDVHRTDRETWMRDVAKREVLRELGWLVIVVVGAHLRDPDALVAMLRRAIRSRR
jgi:very-short-patch-repair endonuclease